MITEILKIDYTDLKNRLRRFFPIIGILFLLGNQGNAYCLNVAPGRIEVSVAPAKSYEDVLMVRNTDKVPVEIKLRVEDWHKAIEGVGGVKGKTPSFNWLEINPVEFGLKEDEIKNISLKVNVPKEAKGELNAMIFIDAKPKETTQGPIAINTSIGIPIYVMVKGTEQFKAEVEDLQVMKSSPLELGVKIKNSGNVHIRPTGTIEIVNADRRGYPQKSALILPLNEYNYPILPNSSRTLEIRSNNRLEAGEYIANIKMGYQDKKYQKRAYLKIQ